MLPWMLAHLAPPGRRALATCRGLVGLLLGGALFGCGEELVDTPRTISLHQLPDCPLPGDDPLVDLEALGDFPAGPRSGEAPSAVGQHLLFPAQTRSIVASMGDGTFVGFTEAGAFGDVEVLLWPLARPCTLAADPQYPAPGGGRAFAYHPGRGLVLIAGGDAGQTSAVVGALTIQTKTGTAALVDAAARHVLLEPRAFASAAPFGDDLIVTGGEDPLVPADRGARTVLEDAEIFSVAENRFLPELLPLHTARSRHRAVSLPSGEVLLVGGRDQAGRPLAVLEAISPVTRLSSLGGLANLEKGRIDPEVIALEGGGLLVLGGVDGDGTPIADAERLSGDGARHLGTTPLAGAPHVTAAPLPGGAALIVLGCGPLPTTEDPETCTPCGDGCAPEPAALWLDTEGQVHPVELEVPSQRPWLVAAADGAPWLLTEGSQWLRFNPWRARFEPGGVPPMDGATLHERPLVLDPGAFLWLEESPAPRVRGLRAGVRHRFTRDLALLTVSHPEDAGWPLHLSPSRPGAAVYADRTLELTAAPVWLADVDFEDVSVEMRAAGAPPIVHLNGELYGDAERPWPSGSAGAPLRLERRGATVTLVRGDQRESYPVDPSARVALGFAAAQQGGTVLAELEVTRLARTAGGGR